MLITLNLILVYLITSTNTDICIDFVIKSHDHLNMEAKIAYTLLDAGSAIFSGLLYSLGMNYECMNFSQLTDGVSFSCFITGTSFSPQENSHNHSSLHSSNSHSNPSKTTDTVRIDS